MGLTSHGIPGFTLELHERVALLVETVGGLGAAAELAEVHTDTVNKWRKKGTKVPLMGMLALARAAGVSLDWVATGYAVRPDLQELPPLARMAEKPGTAPDPGFVRLMPVRPATVAQAGKVVEQWTPSEISVSAEWLDTRFRLSPDMARYAHLDDDGMAPRLGRGAFAIVDTRPAPPRSGIYLIEAGGELLARRLSPMPGGAFELTADADARWRFSADATNIPPLHRIVWAGQEL